ncbi:MAG: DUF4177 domain-containing protein [bacterium]|nr:DUF4177 domain-containing protein [bacterium]
MKWEYNTVEIESESYGLIDEVQLNDEMNQLGQEDWELVSAVATNSTKGQTSSVLLLFKRPFRAEK